MPKEALITVKRAYPVRCGVNFSYTVVYKGNIIYRGKDFKTLAQAEQSAISAVKLLVSKQNFPRATVFRVNIFLGKETVPYFSNVGTVKELEFDYD